MARSAKRYLTVTAVLLVLCVFPLISLFYVNSGISFKKNLYDELLPKDTISDFPVYLMPDSLSNSVSDLLHDKLTLLIKGRSGKDIISDTSKIYHALFHFRDRSDLLLVVYVPSFDEQSLEVFSELAYNADMHLAFTDAQKVLSFFPDSLSSSLSITTIDRHSRVRSYYNLTRGGIYNTLLEHISVLLPEQHKKRHQSGK